MKEGKRFKLYGSMGRGRHAEAAKHAHEMFVLLLSILRHAAHEHDMLGKCYKVRVFVAFLFRRGITYIF